MKKQHATGYKTILICLLISLVTRIDNVHVIRATIFFILIPDCSVIKINTCNLLTFAELATSTVTYHVPLSYLTELVNQHTIVTTNHGFILVLAEANAVWRGG